MSNERADLIATLRYDECDEGCKQPCKLSQQTRDKAADMLERDGEKIAALISWRDDAVLNCARRRCGRREERIAELEAEMARELLAARKAIASSRLVVEWAEPVTEGDWTEYDAAQRDLREYDAIMRDAPVEVPHGECPYPVHKDRSIKACVEAGDCGCGREYDATTREG